MLRSASKLVSKARLFGAVCLFGGLPCGFAAGRPAHATVACVAQEEPACAAVNRRHRHASAEHAATAKRPGAPFAKHCHSQIWPDSATLASARTPDRRVAAVPAAAVGAALFQQYGCVTCHRDDPGTLGPSLAGLYGNIVRLKDGQAVVADEAYLRESILNPQAKVVDGYMPVMPAFEGRIDEEGLLQLIHYIKSLGSGAGNL